MITIICNWMDGGPDFNLFLMGFHDCGNCRGFEVIILGLGFSINI